MSVELDQRKALMVLNGLPHVGPIMLRHLLEEFQADAPEILQAGRSRLLRVKGLGEAAVKVITGWEEHFQLEREEKKMQEHGVSFVTFDDAEYPGLLKEIYDPPIGLYWLGAYRIEEPCVAIVGTRRPTLYGRGVARRLAGDLARLKFCVVSGMARGIDSEAHEGALEAGGKTVALMGCGLDIVYPPENLDLYNRIMETGALVSEFPFGRRADRQTFPMRNRIISGLCRAVVVVESDVKGGSMITARFAGEQGRQVFAVPGRIDQASARGCNQLIRDGATLLTSVDDILDELRYLGQMEMDIGKVEEAGVVAYQLPVDLSDTERRIAECFADGGILHPDTVTRMTQLPQHEVAASIMMLELKRLIAKRADGTYEKR